MTGPAWFCLRTQPKREHIVAGHLAKESGIEVYLPRIRFRRTTPKGPVWFTESLFPNYLFARFDLEASLRQVHHTWGMRGVVRFGRQVASLPDQVILELRRTVPADRVHIIEEQFQPGQPVRISGGAFHGLLAVVTRVMPARERVAVLLEFLGRQTTVELPRTSVLPEEAEPRRGIREGKS